MMNVPFHANGLRGLPARLYQLERQHATAFEFCKVVSSGGTMGAATLYPLSKVEGPSYSVM